MKIDERAHRNLTDFAITLRDVVGMQPVRTLIRIDSDISGGDFFDGDADEIRSIPGSQIALSALKARLPVAALPLVVAYDPESGKGVDFSIGGIPCATTESIGPAMRNAMAIENVLSETPHRGKEPVTLTGPGLGGGHRFSAEGPIDQALKSVAIALPQIDLTREGALDYVGLEKYTLRASDTWQKVDLGDALMGARNALEDTFLNPEPDAGSPEPDFG